MLTGNFQDRFSCVLTQRRQKQNKFSLTKSQIIPNIKMISFSFPSILFCENKIFCYHVPFLPSELRRMKTGSIASELWYREHNFTSDERREMEMILLFTVNIRVFLLIIMQNGN